MSSTELLDFAKQLQSACAGRRVTVATHISPDPDAIGSAFAAGLLCSALGADTKVYLPEPLPTKFQPLVQSFPWTSDLSAAAGDVLLVVDTATRKRVGDLLDKHLSDFPLTFNLDHHISNPHWAAVNCVNGHAAASALLVYQLYESLQQKISPQVANLLYAGILDDTGSFCFSNSSADALTTAASLVNLGASPEDVANTLYFSVPERILRLQARALQNLQVWFEGRVSVLVVDHEILSETACSQEDTEGLVDFARKVDGAVIAVFMRELEGKWKISLRSKSSQYDVNRIAGQFGGGGHAAAAGATIVGTQAEVEQALRTALHSVL